MAQPTPAQMVQVPSDLLQSLITSVNNLRGEIVQLCKDREETQDTINSLQEKVNTLLSTSIAKQATRGAFSRFPELPIEIRNIIWDIALKVPRVVGAKIVVRDRGDKKEALTPTAPTSAILSVNMESRSRAKKVLMCLTEGEERSQDRVPLLYLNPHIDTLWLVNFNFLRFRDERITQSVFGQSKIHKLAMPFSTWEGMYSNCTYGNEGEIIEFIIRCHDTGIQEVILVVGDKDSAESSDAVLIEPREIPEFFLEEDYIQEIKSIYGNRSDVPLRWTCCDFHVDELETIRVDYMMNNGIDEGMLSNSYLRLVLT
jgi:hypothetical protein